MDNAIDNARHQHRQEGSEYRRIELITGTSRRRQWTADEKFAIVTESFKPDVNIADLARRWGINRGLLQTWRREAKRAGASSGAFVPVRLTQESSAGQIDSAREASALSTAQERAAVPVTTGTIEIEGAGLRMRFCGAFDIGALQVVLNHIGRGS